MRKSKNMYELKIIKILALLTNSIYTENLLGEYFVLFLEVPKFILMITAVCLPLYY